MSNSGIKEQEATTNARTPRSPKRTKTTAVARRGPTGPRTMRGKMKSRHNSVRHGIFAIGVLRERESRADFLTLVKDLMKSLRPVGRLEELLVEKLGMLFWRYRRLIGAEAALASNAADAIEHGRVNRQMREVRPVGEKGLLHKGVYGENPFATKSAVDKLNDLRRRIETDGLDWERDRQILSEIFGYDDSRNGQEPNPTEFVSKYRDLAFPEGEATERHVSPSEAKRQMLDLVDDHLNVYAVSSLREMFEQQIDRGRAAAAVLIPTHEAADKLLRYEGTLERAIDRTLAQLERLQRMRLGLAVPPPLKVEVSRS